MNLRQLQYFVSVAESQGVSRAAEGLNISQSALSARIKELEEELGKELFSRHPKGVRLTKAGSTLFPLAVDALQAFERAHDAFTLEENKVTHLSIGLTPTLGAVLLPYLLSSEADHDRLMKLVVRQGSGAALANLLAMREIDAVIWYNEDADTINPIFPILTDHLVLVGSEKILGSIDKLDRGTLVTLPFVSEPPGHIVRRKIDEFFSAGEIPFKPIEELEPFEARRALVLSGSVCTIAPKWLFHPDIEEGRTSYRDLNIPQLSLNLNVVISKSVSIDARTLLLHRLTNALERIDPEAVSWTRSYPPNPREKIL